MGFLWLRGAGATLAAICRLLVATASLAVGHSLGCVGFSSRSTQAQWLWHTSLVALEHVESSQGRGQTHASCIVRWSLNHWMTREVLRYDSLDITILNMLAYIQFKIL